MSNKAKAKSILADHGVRLFERDGLWVTVRGGPFSDRREMQFRSWVGAVDYWQPILRDDQLRETVSGLS